MPFDTSLAGELLNNEPRVAIAVLSSERQHWK
jgi:hypothetical protein